MIKAWSFSRLLDFEACPLRARLKYADKIPEPERPLPPGKTEHANERGHRIHEAAEKYIRGEGELVPELATFKRELAHIRSEFAAGRATTEAEWAMNRDWRPTGWWDDDVWLRLKCDITVRPTPEHMIVVDIKTGKKFGNEIKHMDQVQLYQLVCFLRYPELQRVDVELWYVDKDDLTHAAFDRAKGTGLFKRYDTRAQKLTNATEFPARPNPFTCRWCPYGPKGTGHCEVGVEHDVRPF